jgi:hypothetical protein
MSNRLLPEGTLLGRLDVLEVYDYYDGPRLFLCRNSAGLRYLGLWQGKTGENNKWLYLPLSLVRLEALKNREIDLKSAFVDSEDGIVFEVLIASPDFIANIRTIRSTELSDDILPVASEYLSDPLVVETPELHDLARLASTENRESLRFTFSRQNLTFLPARTAGQFALCIQDLLTRIAFELSGYPASARVPKTITELSELAVTRMSAGSFHIDLVALNSDPLLNRSIHTLLTMFSGQDAPDRLFSPSSKVAAAYESLLKVISASHVAVRVAWASPSGQISNSGELGTAVVGERLHMLSSELQVAADIPAEWKIEEVAGLLVGVNIRTKDYEFFREGKHYFGKISETAMAAAKQATVGKTYFATIRTRSQRIDGPDLWIRGILLGLKPSI